jgi:hypothetical protein
MTVRLSALRAGRPPFTPKYSKPSWPQGHSTAERIRSNEKSSDFIRNRTRDLPACSIVPVNYKCFEVSVCNVYSHAFPSEQAVLAIALRRCWVQMSIETAAILTEELHGFTQSGPQYYLRARMFLPIRHAIGRCLLWNEDSFEKLPFLGFKYYNA